MQPIYFKKGQKVAIHNTTISDKSFVEGMATLIEFQGKEDYPPYRETWVVAFYGDNGETFTRTITPD